MASKGKTVMKERFEQKFLKTPGCWEWKAAKNNKGYGKFSVRRSVWRYAHRISYMLYKGDFDQDLLVCHKCDNPICVNPDHLFLGTQSDNLKDAYKKGRAVNHIMIGEKNPKTKLTDIQIEEIQLRLQNGEVPKSFHKEYGVHWSSIYSRIKRIEKRVKNS